MKTLTWLHISDLHCCPDQTGWDATFIFNKLKNDLLKLKKEHGLTPDIIFVTGDIMYGAKEQCGAITGQYETASIFLFELMEICNVKLENIFLCLVTMMLTLRKFLIRRHNGSKNKI